MFLLLCVQILLSLLNKKIMKKYIFYSFVLLLLSACLPSKYIGNYGQYNQTEISLTESNYKILGSYTGKSTIRSKYEFGYEGMISEARKNLWQNANKEGIKQEGSRILFNVNLEIMYRFTRRMAVVTADIIEFKNDNSVVKITKTNMPVVKEEYKEEKVVKEKAVKENNFLDKISDAFSKDKPKETTTEEKTPVEKVLEEPKQVEAKEQTCSHCNGSGQISKTCTKDGCNNGKVNQTCSVCNGKYADAETECYKCEGAGCDYCNYDGKACDSCKDGKKETDHSVCKGTGKIEQQCTVCLGTGKVKQ